MGASRKALLVGGLLGGVVPYAVLAITCDTFYYIPIYTIGSAFDSFIIIAVYFDHPFNFGSQRSHEGRGSQMQLWALR